MRLLRWAFAATLLVAGLPATSVAQALEVGSFVSYYRPFGRYDPASVYSTSLPQQPSDLAGVGWGAAVRVDLSQRVGLEALISTVSSSLPQVFAPGGPRGPTQARVTFLIVAAQYDVAPIRSRYRLWVNAGPALIQHGGDAYSEYGSPRSIGAAVGARVSASLVSQLQVTSGLRTLWYTFDLKMPAALSGNPGSLQHGPQRDVSIDLGLRWRLR